MENNHKLCLYVSYYLSRYNDQALEELGYSNWKHAFDDIGEKLEVKPHSVKNWRDEFDPLFEHRAGWHQRPMIPSRARVVQALENLDEIQLREIAKDIISGSILKDPEVEDLLLSIVTEKKDNSKKKYIVRAPTGKAAEDFFIKYHGNTGKPHNGQLIDCRDLGCGYDFKIINDKSEIFVEVKGLADAAGGILLTDKEWQTAKLKQESYIICLIRNVNTNPEIQFIVDPCESLSPKKNLFTTIEINWTLTEKQLETIKIDKL